MKETSRAPIVLVLLSLFLAAGAGAADHEEGGYAGTKDEGHDEVVYNFLQHFSYQQYYYAHTFQFGSSNNARVDAMDFAIFGGHGSKWFISTTDGGVDLKSAGGGSNKGWGDTDAEFVAFQSCKVVPSPLEVADWSTNWVKSGGMFDGLHQALGFRTDSWQSTDEDITDEFGDLIQANFAVWQAWFYAIDDEGRSDEFGSAVMHPSAQWDSYASLVADPPANHQSLTIWYQH